MLTDTLSWRWVLESPRAHRQSTSKRRGLLGRELVERPTTMSRPTPGSRAARRCGSHRRGQNDDRRTLVVAAELTPDLACREPVGVDVAVDRPIPQSVEQGVETVVTRREPLRGQGQDLGGRDGAGHGAGWARARRRAGRDGGWSGTV